MSVSHPESSPPRTPVTCAGDVHQPPVTHAANERNLLQTPPTTEAGNKRNLFPIPACTSAVNERLLPTPFTSNTGSESRLPIPPQFREADEHLLRSKAPVTHAAHEGDMHLEASITRTESERIRDPRIPVQMNSPVKITTRFLMPSAIQPPMSLYLTILDRFLGPSLRGMQQPRVIAVDGTDNNAVQTMIANLNHHMVSQLGYVVRVMGNAYSRPPIDTPNPLDCYSQQIRAWNIMWQTLLHAPLPTRVHRHECIYILPLSPLMVTIRAFNQYATTDASSTVEFWQWLASRWAGYRRPGITINIQGIDSVSVDREVLRFQGCNMDTIVVTNMSDGGVELAPLQLQRVSLEVEEWLRSV